MRESGFIGLIQVVFDCVRDGFGLRRAWLVALMFALIFLAPFVLLALFLLLLAWIF